MTIEREQELLERASALLDDADGLPVGPGEAAAWATEAAANVALAAELRARRGDWPRVAS